ncbi:hypothetical protein ABTH81_21060, partial [Acinetobacter baumannii]
ADTRDEAHHGNEYRKASCKSCADLDVHSEPLMECDKEKTQSLYAAALPHYKEYPDARGQ